MKTLINLLRKPSILEIFRFCNIYNSKTTLGIAPKFWGRVRDTPKDYQKKLLTVGYIIATYRLRAKKNPTKISGNRADFLQS